MSADGPIIVVARWLVDASSVEAVLGLIGTLREETLAEPGCLGYDVYRAMGASSEILLLERYTDASAIDAHRESPHYRKLVVERIMPLLVERKVELLIPRPA